MLGFNGGRVGKTNTVFTGTVSDDPSYSSVSLLLNGNGTNGSTTFTDSSSYGHTVTPVGNAQISTTQSKFGGASIYLDGSGDYLQSPTSTDFILGTNDFTLEAWIYPLGFAGAPNYNNYGPIFEYRTANVSQVNVLLSFIGSSTLVFYVSGSARITGSAISTNQWTHVALTRSSGITRMFINGIQSGSSYSDTNSYVSSVFRIGGNIAGDAFFNGYIDDLRITKGVARYTSNFTPPKAELPGAVTGTFASGVWTPREQCDAVRKGVWP